MESIGEHECPEWFDIEGNPKGSAEFKGSAGVLAKSIAMFYDWAKNHK